MAQQLYRVRGVELAKVAKVKAFRGGDVDLTADRLQRLAECYDPAKHEARVIVGHTDDQDAPSFGYVENLRFEGQTLFGDYAGLTDSAARDFTRTGRYPRRSIELTDVDGEYLGDAAQLGARRPAIKGLAPILPHQIEPMSEAECLAFSERDGAVGDSIAGFLFSEADDETPIEEPIMANETDVQLAEENGTLKAQLSEKDVALAERDAKLAEFEAREAKHRLELAFGEAKGDALSFAEGLGVKLGSVPKDDVAALIAQARTEGYKTRDGKCFGEAIETLLKELPNQAPILGGGRTPDGEKPEGEAFAEDDNSDAARYHRIDSYAKEHDMSFSEASTALKGGYNNA